MGFTHGHHIASLRDDSAPAPKPAYRCTTAAETAKSPRQARRAGAPNPRIRPINRSAHTRHTTVGCTHGYNIASLRDDSATAPKPAYRCTTAAETAKSRRQARRAGAPNLRIRPINRSAHTRLTTVGCTHGYNIASLRDDSATAPKPAYRCTTAAETAKSLRQARRAGVRQ